MLHEIITSLSAHLDHHHMAHLTSHNDIIQISMLVLLKSLIPMWDAILSISCSFISSPLYGVQIITDYAPSYNTSHLLFPILILTCPSLASICMWCGHSRPSLHHWLDLNFHMSLILSLCMLEIRFEFILLVPIFKSLCIAIIWFELNIYFLKYCNVLSPINSYLRVHSY